MVPFAHLALYAGRLPRATVREFDDRGHQLGDDLSEVTEDIARLQRRKGILLEDESAVKEIP